MRTDEEIQNATPAQLYAFLDEPDDPTRNIDALRSDAEEKLQELRDDGSITYQYHELSDKVKDKVSQWLEPEYDWWDCVYADAKEDGKALGFEIGTRNQRGNSGGSPDICFSGFWSQGDGACWQGQVNIPAYLTHWLAEPDAPTRPDYMLKLALLSALIESDAGTTNYWRISTSGSYSHSMSMGMDDRDELLHEYPWSGENDFLLLSGPFQGASVCDTLEALSYDENEFADEVLAAAREYADTIYDDLEQEYDHLTSQEHIAEECEANDWWFTWDGEIGEKASPQTEPDGIRLFQGED